MDFDASIIRPQLRQDDFKLRGEGFSKSRLKGIKKGLQTLHTLELMAQNIYKFQITKEADEYGHINRWKKLLESSRRAGDG